MKNLHYIARAKDRNPVLFVQHSCVKVDGNNIRIINKDNDISISPNTIGLLMLGPGTSITHESIKLLTDYHTQLQWVADDILHTYATAFDIRQRQRNLIKQAYLVSWSNKRLEVAKNMYMLRFGQDAVKANSLESLRGMEGARVAQEYNRIAKQFGLVWKGRNYVPGKPNYSDLPNKMLSLANSYLYGFCLSVILQLGFSPALGFVHSGFGLSFVYDVADFYKTKYIVPIVFSTVASNLTGDIKDKVRSKIIEVFEETKLIQQIETDLSIVLDVSITEQNEENGLWCP